LEDFSAHLAEMGPVFSLDGHASGATVRELLHGIFHALRMPIPAGNSAVQCAHLRRVCVAAAGGKRGSASTALAEVRAEAARPGAHASDGVLRHVLKLLPVHTEAPDAGGSFLLDDGEAELLCGSSSVLAQTVEIAAAPEPACALGTPAGRQNGAAEASSSGSPAGTTQPSSDSRPVATQPGTLAGGRLVATPTKKGCGTPGCTLANFHTGHCSHVQAQLEGPETGPPSKRLRRGRDEAALDRIDWDAAGGRTARLPAHAAVKVPSDMYVVVHGLDAPALRTEASQNVLAALASLPQVHLIGSTSHRNAALLWEAQLVRQLNPLWVELSTAQPYAAECLDTVHKLLENLQDASASSASQSAESVLRALTDKGRDTFCFLLQHQLDDPKSAGLCFTDLFNGCRDKDHLSDEAQLHTLLREYNSHALVRMRPGHGGRECYYCTLPPAKMQQIVAAQAAATKLVVKRRGLS
jgi:origin recognition complex subunit 2